MKNCRGDHWSPVKDIQSKEKNMDKVNILGVHVDMVNISQATDCIMRFLDEDKFHAVYTPNSEIIMLAYKDEKFLIMLTCLLPTA